MPKIPLARANTARHRMRADLARPTEHRVTRRPPKTINDLSPTFDFQDGAVGQTMLENFGVKRLAPEGLPIDDEAFLHVDHMIVQEPWDFQGVRSGAVSVQNDLTVGQMGFCDGLPLACSNGARTRGARASLFWDSNGTKLGTLACLAVQLRPTAPK